MPKEDKSFRLLRMYETLNKGAAVEKPRLAQMFGVSEKTVQRDIDDLRAYVAEEGGGAVIEYDKAHNAYSLVRREREWLSNEEVLALVKIVLESRAFPKDEVKLLAEKLIGQAIPEDRPFVRDMIKNELFYYVQPRHGKNLLSPIWELSRTIKAHDIIKFTYERQDGARGERTVKPVAVMFSEFYFYLIAYLANGLHEYPAVFRVDRIEDVRITGEKFSVPHEKKFSDGEFRKRVQFMYPGELERVTFDFKGDSIEAVLDRLPTAEIVGERDGTYTVTAEVYGRGVDMWLRSQGDFVSRVRREKI
ncbi:MAG: WYL domain-containing protein [Synergistaceae bacterium]|jgi:predicted DNA-binding transcriptional regulator YafY|nr:WYL domain-containing protein [Synergistaceae bacterium]